jgi:short-subunit dehydrogenase
VIYNISSCAGFAPLGNYAVYAASKAFVNSFSLSLRAEVRDQDIQVITVTPASVDTHFHIISRGESGRQKRYFNSRISPRTVVEKSIQSAERNRVFSCPDRVSRAACFWRKLVPHPLIARLAFIKLYQ